MPLKLSCPSCGADLPLSEPYPMPGDPAQCARCAAKLAVTYPPGVMESLTKRGKSFASNSPRRKPVQSIRAERTQRVRPSPRPPAKPSVVRRSSPAPKLTAPPTAATIASSGSFSSVSSSVGTAFATSPTEMFHDYTPEDGLTEVDPTCVEHTVAEEPDFFRFDRTVPSMQSPYGHLAVAEPGRISPDVKRASREVPGYCGAVSTSASAGDSVSSKTPKKSKSTKQSTSKKNSKSKRRGFFGCLGSLGGIGSMGCLGVIGLGLLGAGVAAGGYYHYSQDLPTIEALRAYRPPTVTVVTDSKGVVLGEIYEQRRYVTDIDDIPDHVKEAFMAAEDANFYHHGGVDFMGIVRAVLRNAAKGKAAQGASTITQQVARNFLLTRDKKLERKIKEVILSWRIEEAYSKDHILFLYLNEIFLGSQAYGVEAASRAYFGKHVSEITVAEAAILAGLPQRPSDYSPHRGWKKSRARQEYVIRQMVEKKFLSKEDGEKALAQEIVIAGKENKFLEQAPYFTEHVRRILVEKYGKDTVLNGGLQVKTTCDLDLQRVAQKAVTDGVFSVDQRTGFRRDAIEKMFKTDDEINTWRAEYEKALIDRWVYVHDPGKRQERPTVSELEKDQFVKAVVLEAHPKWLRVAIGSHEGIIPLAWASWAYEPNPKRSWRGRRTNDLTLKVDTDDDGKADSAILQKGDLLRVKIHALSTADEDNKKVFKGTPAEKKEFVAVKLWQVPKVESALLSMELPTGHIKAMVGGADFTRSQFNRAVQSYRQVGSTFKPLVYGAAIETEKITSASIVPDAPLAITTSVNVVWKPTNYGASYAGNLTLRWALAKSKNTCTVRVLESIDPNMADDVIYNFARKLGIGGVPTYRLPPDHVPSPANDHLCPWEPTPGPEQCGADSFQKEDGSWVCRRCNPAMGLGAASLTMEEMVRAYSPFAQQGKLIEPVYILEVRDRNGEVLEAHEPVEPPQVMSPQVAFVGNWLLQGVANGGTATRAKGALGLRAIGGKTGTTNDEKDAWFVGFTNDVVTAAWVGYDEPATLGRSSTGGSTAMPIWIEYMKVAAPKDRDRDFPQPDGIQWAGIDEKTGRRLSGGGARYPFLKDTLPEATGVAAGQASMEDLTSEL